MSRKPIFTIVMACHNAGAYIDQAIASVLAQTFADWELIIVDDASHDDSLSCIKNASQKDPRIKYIQNEINLGPSIARNSAAHIATGEWLSILDADDVYLPEKLEKQYEIILNSKADIVLVGSGCYHIDHTGRRLQDYNYSNKSMPLKRALLSMRSFPPHSSLIYRKEAFLAVGGFNSNFIRSQDYDLWLRLINFGSFAAYSKPLIEYRVHSSNISNSSCTLAFTQVEYGIAATVCQLIRNGGFVDPSRTDHESWFEFVTFVADQVRQSGYKDFVFWKKNIKNDLLKSASLYGRLIIFSLAMYRSPSNVANLVQERISGCRLPAKIYKSWLKNKVGR
jgi:glycosyltransferase involved in cell wall biosynthesis